MEKEKVIIRVEQEVENCFECPYCVQDFTTLYTAGKCSRGEFKIDNVFSGVAEKCPFRNGSNEVRLAGVGEDGFEYERA